MIAAPLLDRVAPWCIAQVAALAQPGRACVIAINGPQGGGKTTLTNNLVTLLGARGLRVASVSIDDFYLTNAEQRALAAQHSDNCYLQQRGHPGTHDVQLGERTIIAMRSSSADIIIPTYDKAADNGRGERHPQSAWRTVRGPLDVAIVEGWMLGFRAAAPEYSFTDVALAAVDALLPGYAAWHTQLDAMIQLRAADHTDIAAWRVEAEDKLRAEGRGAMTPAAARAYIELFLPSYTIYPARLARTPLTPQRHLTVTLDRNRLPLA